MWVFLFTSMHEECRIFETLVPCSSSVQKLLGREHRTKAVAEAQRRKAVSKAQNLRKAVPRYGISGEESCLAVRRSCQAQKTSRGSCRVHLHGSQHITGSQDPKLWSSPKQLLGSGCQTPGLSTSCCLVWHHWSGFLFLLLW